MDLNLETIKSQIIAEIKREVTGRKPTQTATPAQEVTFGFHQLQQRKTNNQQMEQEFKPFQRLPIDENGRAEERRSYQPKNTPTRRPSNYNRGTPRTNRTQRDRSREPAKSMILPRPRNRGMCFHGEKCDWGLDCDYEHTKEEEDLFLRENRRRNTRQRPGYQRPKSANRGGR